MVVGYSSDAVLLTAVVLFVPLGPLTLQCAVFGTPGCSFAAPGPFSNNEEFNIIQGGIKKHKGIKFRAYVNPKDIVPSWSRDKAGVKALKAAKTALNIIQLPTKIALGGMLPFPVFDLLGDDATTEANDMHIVREVHALNSWASGSNTIAKLLDAHNMTNYCKSVGELDPGKMYQYVEEEKVRKQEALRDHTKSLASIGSEVTEVVKKKKQEKVEKQKKKRDVKGKTTGEKSKTKKKVQV